MPAPMAQWVAGAAGLLGGAWATLAGLGVMGISRLRCHAYPPPTEWPDIDIAVAARNEEAGLEATLRCLMAQDYPGAITVWVGDDASTDATPRILAQIASEFPGRLKFITITETLPGLGGKQNVLAQLLQHGTAPYVLMTDADITLPPTWARTIVNALVSNPQVGLVAGPTVVAGRGLFARFQTLDWLFGVGVIAGLAGWGLPLTVVGNNLAIRREAYEATGGYAALPFSVTEDFLLFQAIQRHGWQWRWLLDPEARCHTGAVPTLGALAHQRKRWFRGGQGGPWYGVGVLGLHTLLYPLAAVLGGVAGWPWGVGLFGAKTLIDFSLLAATAWRIRLGGNWAAAYPLYVLWLPVQLVILAIAFALPGRVRWKGRKL